MEFEMDIIEKENAFELCSDTGETLGAVEFVEKGDKIVITHTRVNEELRSQGFAAQLILKTIEKAKANNLEVGATCSYAKHYLETMDKQG